MPNISNFMYCERIEPGPNGQLLLTNPLLIINPMFVPGMFSFGVVFGIKDMNLDENHALRLLFLSPDEKDAPIIDTNNLPLARETLSGQKIGLPVEEQGVMLNLDFRNVVLKSEGTYKTVIILDGVTLGEYSIYVKAGG